MLRFSLWTFFLILCVIYVAAIPTGNTKLEDVFKEIENIEDELQTIIKSNPENVESDEEHKNQFDGEGNFENDWEVNDADYIPADISEYVENYETAEQFDSNSSDKKKKKITEYEINKAAGFNLEEIWEDNNEKRGIDVNVRLWEKDNNGELHIPYIINTTAIPRSSLKYKRIENFIQTMNSIMTCNDEEWRERRGEQHYVEFTDSEGCASYVGRITSKSPQEIFLADGCVLYNDGTVIHEMMHAMGFYHEIQRSDRDQYVTINYTNVINGERNGNFRKRSTRDHLESPYDYRSVMHYGRNFFAINRDYDTIIPSNASFLDVIGQRDGASPIDIQQINKLYGCDVASTTTTVQSSETTTTSSPTETMVKTTMESSTATSTSPNISGESTETTKTSTEKTMSTVSAGTTSTTSEITTSETLSTTNVVESTSSSTESPSTNPPTIPRIFLGRCSHWQSRPFSCIHRNFYIGRTRDRGCKNFLGYNYICERILKFYPNACNYGMFSKKCPLTCAKCGADAFLSAIQRVKRQRTCTKFRKFWFRNRCIRWNYKKLILPSYIFAEIRHHDVQKELNCQCNRNICEKKMFCVSIQYRRAGSSRPPFSKMSVSLTNPNFKSNKKSNAKYLLDKSVDGKWKKVKFEFQAKCTDIELTVVVLKGNDYFHVDNATIYGGSCSQSKKPTEESEGVLNLFDLLSEKSVDGSKDSNERYAVLDDEVMRNFEEESNPSDAVKKIEKLNENFRSLKEQLDDLA